MRYSTTESQLYHHTNVKKATSTTLTLSMPLYVLKSTENCSAAQLSTSMQYLDTGARARPCQSSTVMHITQLHQQQIVNFISEKILDTDKSASTCTVHFVTP